MRVAMVAPHFHPEIGGLETSVRLLAAWLVDRGHDVVVHTAATAADGRTLPPTDAVDGVVVRRYPLRLNLGYFRSAFRPDVRSADVVHLHGYAVLTNDLVARRVRVPLVYSLLHGVRMPHPSPWTRFERALYDRFLGVPTLRRVDAVVALNAGDVSWLASRGIVHARVLPSPLPPEAFLPGDPARARARFGDARYVLFVGRLHREKGVVDLVTALAGVPGLEAWLAGPDAGTGRELIRTAERLGIRDRVRVLGPVSEQEKRDLLSASEFLVLPSVYEAQGLVVGEAWAQGKAVVATRVGALPDWIEDGRTGLLVPAAKPGGLSAALAALAADPERATQMGRAGAQRASALRIERIAPEFEALYDSLRGAASPP